jgi:SSS family solute:Na+ symporter/sodium/pantothenate symporter
MSTVSSFLVVLSAGLVRDLYQRFVNPHASAERLRWLSYAAMLLIGGFAVVANIKPVAYLQALVVFSGSGVGATFFAPACLSCYWKRATAAGVLAAMLIGAGITLTLYVVGFLTPDPYLGPATSFRPYYLLGVEPIVWALPGSFIAGIGVSLLSTPPDQHLLERAFGERKP